MTFVAVFTVIIAAEIATAGLVWWLRRRCQWLITRQDLTPLIDRDGLNRFMAHSWDKHLGWVRKPNTAHDETIPNRRPTRYHIASNGARSSPEFNFKRTVALAYGDSYTFCRLVHDDEAWPHLLSEPIGGHVANRGVGNYGMDQAVLRLERDFDADPASVVFMGVVPETICRVMNVWGHFREYGNILAFKPSFALKENGNLKLIPNPLDGVDKFNRIAELLPLLIERDFLYARKFAPDMLFFPYLWRLWRSRKRNIPLMIAALRDRLRPNGQYAFCQVMDRNIQLASDLYAEPKSIDLLVAITKRFAAFVRSKDAMPILIILPQLYDLKQLRAGNHYYAEFLNRIAGVCQIIDLGPHFASLHDDAVNYINDKYGGHLSPQGNRIVVQRIMLEILGC